MKNSKNNKASRLEEENGARKASSNTIKPIRGGQGGFPEEETLS